jgi:protein-disulfide isomerase
MASRKEQKEQARARRLAEEQARAQKAQRDRRLRMIGGVVVGAIVVIVAAIAISSGGGSSKATGLQKGSAASKTATSVQNLLAGIPQSGAQLGNPKAPVTMTYYGDLECPICQDFTLNGGFPELVSKDVRDGKVKVVYRAFQTATRDPNVFKTQQVAALAAGQQQKFWNYTELFYRQQGQEDTGYVNEAYLTGLAKQIPGLNMNSWQSARNDAALANQVATDQQTGNSLGVSGTPTLVFKGPSGKTATPSASVPSYSQLQQTIKQVS